MNIVTATDARSPCPRCPAACIPTVNGLPKSAINVTLDGMNIQDNYLKMSDGFLPANFLQRPLV